MKLWVCLAILAGTLPLGAKEKAPMGDIPEPAAFAAITTYCIDAHDLPGYEANDVNMFVSRKSKPRKLLSKLPWKFLRDCHSGNPSAVIKVKFPLLNVIGARIGPPQDPLRTDPESYRTKAVMEISDPDSEKMLYHVQAWLLDNGVLGDGDVTSHDPPPLQRQNALYNALGKLVEDVKRAASKK